MYQLFMDNDTKCYYVKLGPNQWEPATTPDSAINNVLLGKLAHQSFRSASFLIEFRSASELTKYPELLI